MKPIDKIALIIAVTTASILLIITISPLVTGRQLSEEKARIFGDLLMSYMSMLGIYIGARLQAIVGKKPDDPGD